MRGKVRKTKLFFEYPDTYTFKTFDGYENIQVCSNNATPEYRELSPFLLGPVYVDDPNIKKCETMENFWIYTKVYKCDISEDGDLSQQFLSDRLKWFASKKTDTKRLKHLKKHRKDFLYFWYDCNKLGNYVEGRKVFYCGIYSELVQQTDAYKKLKQRLDSGENLCLTGWDSADWSEENDPKCDLLYERLINKDKGFGHASVLACLLTENRIWEKTKPMLRKKETFF